MATVPYECPFYVRLDETLNLNNKLDQSVRKKEENIRTLEKTLQTNEQRYGVTSHRFSTLVMEVKNAR